MVLVSAQHYEELEKHIWLGVDAVVALPFLIPKTGVRRQNGLTSERAQCLSPLIFRPMLLMASPRLH